MISDKNIQDIRSKIDDTTSKPDNYYGNDFSPPYDFGTTHLSIIAEDGSAVGVTSSINDVYETNLYYSKSNNDLFTKIIHSLIQIEIDFNLIL